MQKAQGFVENGNLVITVGGVSAAQKAQGSYPQATVNVYNAGTLVLATIYSDNSSTPKANPFTAATNGYFFFYAANGRYDVTFSGGGLSAPLTFGDVLLADPFASGGAVTSFNGRTGAVVPATNDYALSQINGWPTGSELQYLRRKPNNGATAAYEFASLFTLNAADYNFTAITPTGSPNLSIGSNTITLPVVPNGVAGTNSDYYVYISGGTGTAEACLVTGGTATPNGLAQTLIITCANTHSGAYTVASATGGLSEAVWALPSTGGWITVPASSITLYAPVTNRAIPMWIRGAGWDSTVFSVASTFSLAATGIFKWTSNPNGSTVRMPGGMSGFTLLFPQPDSTNVATYTHWPPAFYLTSTHRPQFCDIVVGAAWDVWKSTSNDGATIQNCTISPFHRGVDFDGQTDTVRIENLHVWPVGLTNNQTTAFIADTTANKAIEFGNVQNFIVIGLSTIAGGGAATMKAGSGGSPSGAFVNCNFDTVGGYVQEDGNVLMSNITISLTAANYGISVLGGLCTINNLSVYCNGGCTGIPVRAVIEFASTGAASLVTPGIIWNGGEVINYEDTVTLQATTALTFVGVAAVHVQGVTFDRGPGVIYTTAVITQASGTGTMRMRVVGNKFKDIGGGSSIAVALQDDNDHVVIGNEGGNSAYSLGGITKTQWFGNINFASNIHYLLSATKITGRLSAATFAPRQTENYIASETGANNAIAGALLDAAGTAIPQASGLVVTVKLGHTLQAGANTFALNGASAVSIKSARNPANNIGTAWAATGTIRLLYDSTGPYYLDMSQ